MKILMRHRVACGRNWDIICGSDLTLKSEQRAFWRYRAEFQIQVVIMAPICGPFGSMSRLSKVIHYDSWKESFDYALELGSFCGYVALAQLNDGLDFFVEQPVGSELYAQEPWPLVRGHSRTRRTVMDQCQTGAQSRNGQPIRKRSEL